MADTSLRASAVVTPRGVVGPATVEIRDGRIAMVRPAHGSVPDRILIPGFVDLQVNGVGVVDVATARGREWDEIGRALLSTGVTSWLPTVVTRGLQDYPPIFERIEAAMDRAADPSEAQVADVMGVHLEGPFLGERPGAHATHLIRGVDNHFVATLPPIVKLVTLAPEADGAVEATRTLVDRGIRVAIGHTAATEERLEAVRQAGASMVTHLFNAMTGVTHREPGVAAWALTTDGVATSIIGDLHHVSMKALQIALRCKPATEIIAVTDAVAHMRHDLRDGGGGRPARLADGTIAGSTVTMDACFRHLRQAGADLVSATLATSTNPAALLGLADRGALEAGRVADIVALDRDERVVGVWKSGRQSSTDSTTSGAMSSPN